jgi:uncharacterized membrane protein YbjE (DUF340 family)
MTAILFFLIFGIGLGFILRRQMRVLAIADKVTTWSVYLLIFFLGTSVGVNQTVMKALHSLGMQALILSLGSIAGSVLVTGGIYFYFFREK